MHVLFLNGCVVSIINLLVCAYQPRLTFVEYCLFIWRVLFFKLVISDFCLSVCKRSHDVGNSHWVTAVGLVCRTTRDQDRLADFSVELVYNNSPEFAWNSKLVCLLLAGIYWLPVIFCLWNILLLIFVILVLSLC